MVYADNAQRGPYSVSQLENFRRNGEVPIDALVWTEGMSDWQPIATVLAPAQAAPAPPRFAPVVVANPNSGVKESDYTYFLIAHILLGVALLTGGISGIVSLIMAYVKRDEVRGTYLESHAKWIVETFWWSFWLYILGGLLTFILVGFGLIFAVWVWSIYRVVLGAIRISERRAV